MLSFVKQNQKTTTRMLPGLTNNKETGLGLGIRASHKGIDGGLWRFM